jgi:phosphopantetheinyl transferase (holo-ACP synthase)
LISTGCDIVALDEIDARRTRQERFYTKILSPAELSIYQCGGFAALPLEHFVWLLWSVKESVYKCAQRNSADIIFSPRKIIITQIEGHVIQSGLHIGEGQHESTVLCEKDCFNCKIIFGAKTWYSKSKIYNKFIYTVAGDDSGFDSTWWGVKKISTGDYEGQSKEIRSFILQKLGIIFLGASLAIEKSATGYPYLVKEKVIMDIPLSFTHHGRYIGYSFLL